MRLHHNIHRPLAILNQWSKVLDDKVYHGVDNDENTVASSAWTPLVDIKEENQRYVLHADIPGVDPKDIEITMEKEVLTIRGVRNNVTEEESQHYKRIERIQGTFYRRFTLPDTADTDNITATGKNGVLEIVIPKQAKVQPRRIAVALLQNEST